MREPDSYNATVMFKSDTRTDKELDNGQWVPARPYGLSSMNPLKRFKLAWAVFTGSADALFWD